MKNEMNTATKVTTKAKAFSGEKAKEYSFEVDSNGTVRVWDEVAGHYTTVHALSQSEQDRIRNLAQSETVEAKVHIFQEADGWHWSPKSAEYLDARGKGYPTQAEALRAAQAHYEQANDNLL